MNDTREPIKIDPKVYREIKERAPDVSLTEAIDGLIRGSITFDFDGGND